MNHYTYIIKNLYNGKIYIGVRTCECDPTQDNYWSSSRHLNDLIKRYGKDHLRKRILRVHDTRENAMLHEIELHNKYDVAVNERFYNKAKQTSTGFDTTGTYGSWNGRTHTDETKVKMSETKKGKTACNKGVPMKKEQKEKLTDTWEVITPDDEKIVINNMLEFCRQHNLNPSSMSAVSRGNRRHYKNYKCKKLTNNRNVEYEFKEWKSKGHQAKIRIGANNGFSKKIKVDGVIYNCMREATEKTGLSMYLLRKRGEFL